MEGGERRERGCPQKKSEASVVVLRFVVDGPLVGVLPLWRKGGFLHLRFR